MGKQAPTAPTPPASHLAREYETIYVLRPDVDRQTAEQIATRMNDVVAREGGKLTRVDNWGRRRLAYDVGNHKRAIYVYLKFLGDGGVVSEMERNLRMLDAVLKYQTVKVRDGVLLADAEVSPDEVKFEHVEAIEDDEDDLSYARSLGLEESRSDQRRGDADASAGDGGGDAEEQGVERDSSDDTADAEEQK